MKPALLLPALVIGSWANWTDLVWDDIRAATSCAACETLLRSLQTVARRGPVPLETVITKLCIQSKIFDAEFCAGLVASQIPSAHHVLSQLQIPSFTAQTFCASVLDLCPPPPPRPVNLTLPLPPSPLSPPPPATTPPAAAAAAAAAASTLRIAHLTDTHVDLLYTPGSSTSCRKPICCRPYTPRDARDITTTTKPCPAWGHPRCDPPLRLLQSLLSAVHALQPQLAVYTGDVVPHDIWNESQPSVLSSFNTTYAALRTLNCPLYPAIGNHDTHPLNLFPVSDTIPAPLNPQWAYDALATHWRTLLPNTPGDPIPIHHGAYATTLTLPNITTTTTTNTTLKIISYNSNLYYRLNLLTYTTPMSLDPLNQFSWLITELTTAEHLAQKVYLITHIPSTSKDTLPEYASSLRTIFHRFKNTIVGVFCGHGHIDTFGVIYPPPTTTITPKNKHEHNPIPKPKNNKTDQVIELMTPSITPTSGHPAFRILTVDITKWEVLDSEIWIGLIPSLPSSSSYSTSSLQEKEPPTPIWKKYYSVRNTYGRLIPQYTNTNITLGATFWVTLIELMEWNRQVFGEYWARRTRGWHVPVCKGGCREREICRLRGGCRFKKLLSLGRSLVGEGDGDGEDGNGNHGWGDVDEEGEGEGGALGRWVRWVQAEYPIN